MATSLLMESVVSSDHSAERYEGGSSRRGHHRRDFLLCAVVAIATLVASGFTNSTQAQQPPMDIPGEIIHNWGWFLVFGIGLVVLGVAAIVRSVAATVVSMLFFGWLLLIAAGIEVAQTVMFEKWAGALPHMMAAILFVVVGVLIIWRQLVTAEILTLLMGAFFLVAGLFHI